MHDDYNSLSGSFIGFIFLNLQISIKQALLEPIQWRSFPILSFWKRRSPREIEVRNGHFLFLWFLPFLCRFDYSFIYLLFIKVTFFFVQDVMNRKNIDSIGSSIFIALRLNGWEITNLDFFSLASNINRSIPVHFWGEIELNIWFLFFSSLHEFSYQWLQLLF